MKKTFWWSKGPEERMFRLLRTIKFPNILYCTQTLILATKIPYKVTSPLFSTIKDYCLVFPFVSLIYLTEITSWLYSSCPQILFSIMNIVLVVDEVSLFPFVGLL